MPPDLPSLFTLTRMQCLYQYKIVDAGAVFSDRDSTVKPVEFLWRMVVHVLTTTESVEGSLMFSEYIFTIAKPFVGL